MRFHAYESSPGSSSDEDGCGEMEMSPTILLDIAIQKRRALFGLKERDYRLELLQSSLIQPCVSIWVNVELAASNAVATKREAKQGTVMTMSHPGSDNATARTLSDSMTSLFESVGVR